MEASVSASLTPLSMSEIRVSKSQEIVSLERSSSRLEKSVMGIEMEVEWPLTTFVPAVLDVVLTLPSSPITWNLETGSKVKVPGPLTEKSYRDDTVVELRSAGIVCSASNLRAHPRARRSHYCRSG